MAADSNLQLNHKLFFGFEDSVMTVPWAARYDEWVAKGTAINR